LWLGFEKLILCCPHSAHSPFSIAPRALSVAFCASVKTDLPKLYFAIATTAHYFLTMKGQKLFTLSHLLQVSVNIHINCYINSGCTGIIVES
jgi:hypothetical protein